MNQQAPQTLDRLFVQATELFRDRPLIVVDSDSSLFTFGDTALIVSRLAAALSACGLKKGDCVASVAPLCAEAVFVFHAAMKLGLVFVPLDHDMPVSSLRQILARIDCQFVFSDRLRFSLLGSDSGIPYVIYDDDLDSPSHVSASVFSEWMDANQSEEVQPDVIPEVIPELVPGLLIDERDPAVILFTSGTTGEPKGVELSHGALWRSGKVVHDTWEWDVRDLVFSLGELWAMSGLRNPCVVPLHAGCSVLCAEESGKADIFSVMDTVRRTGATVLGTTPTLARLMVEHRHRIGVDCGKLRHVICTGSELRADTARDFMSHYRLPLYNYYGLTETSGICVAMSRRTERLASGSVGIAAGAPLRIVNGELQVGGANLMSGYFNDPDQTASVIREGWFQTGDEAEIDAEGYVTLKGRRRDIIKDARGNLIHPGEVESVLSRAASVKDVGVCGFVSPFGDERLAAFVVLHDTVAQVQAEVGLRKYVELTLGKQKVPAVFQFVASLPRDHLGSLLRRELKKWLKEKV